MGLPFKVAGVADSRSEAVVPQVAALPADRTIGFENGRLRQWKDHPRTRLGTWVRLSARWPS